jgi:MFS family permease
MSGKRISVPASSQPSGVARGSVGQVGTTSDLGLIAPLAAGEVMATLPLYLSPVVLGALTDHLGFGPERAGMLLTAELGVLAFVTLFGAAWVPRQRWKQAAHWGILLALLGNLGSLAATNWIGLGALRLVAGVGEGLVYMVCTGYLPLARNRERLAAITVFCSVTSAMIWLVFFPGIVTSIGHAGIFLPPAVVTLGAWPLVARLPPAPLAQPAEPIGETVSAGHASPRAGHAPQRTKGVVLLPLAVLATQLAQGCFWSFLPVAGEKSGVARPVIDLALSTSTLALLIGVVAAGLLGTRVGRAIPLIGSIFINALSMAAAFGAAAPGVFLAANLVQASTNLFAVIYQIGLAAHADPRGRIAAAACGTVLLGNGIAPAVGGVIIEHAGWPALLPTILGLNLAAVLVFATHLPAAARFELGRGQSGGSLTGQENLWK